MVKILKVFRKIAVALVGFPLLIVGIILVPLPGPGLVVMFLALLLLSTEFDWTQKYLDKAKAAIMKIYKTAQDRSDKIVKK